MKIKTLIIIAMLILLAFCSGITYSFFHSDSTLSSNDQNIAKFIFKTASLNQIQLPLIGLNPGDDEEYIFAVSNNDLGVLSDVSIEYQMTIKTYHLVPLIIELYRVNGEAQELILTCDESYTRNSANELICNTPLQEMEHHSEELDNYKLKVAFSSEHNDQSYSNLVDYINIEIKSWQKIED